MKSDTIVGYVYKAEVACPACITKTMAGIMPGDLVIVERGREAKQGDIVIAQVDGQWTMKYFEKLNGKVILKAANKKYPVIVPQRELVIGGVVVANVRKYK